MSLADPLRHDLGSMLMEQYGYPLQFPRDKELARPLLIALADLLKGLYGEDCLVERLVERARSHDLVVVDDVRFPNEATALAREGLCLVRLTMGSREYGERVRSVLGRELAPWERDHPSENALDAEEEAFRHDRPSCFRYVLDVSGLSFADLERALDSLVWLEGYRAHHHQQPPPVEQVRAGPVAPGPGGG